MGAPRDTSDDVAPAREPKEATFGRNGRLDCRCGQEKGGGVPVFIHAEDDVASFRMITSQFCVQGCARQSDIIRAFGVTSISVKRSVKTYREKAPKGFYSPSNPTASHRRLLLGSAAVVTGAAIASSLSTQFIA